MMKEFLCNTLKTVSCTWQALDNMFVVSTPAATGMILISAESSKSTAVSGPQEGHRRYLVKGRSMIPLVQASEYGSQTNIPDT